ncbi:NUDIX hydrolase [Promicromonospora iranensis]|uniref:8-oxo-dGTP pyrophosphatase MutT (NUDIX family) n=1 Tax=Promicromonospora iranensis TaxID=1105144 RepID=A0ABU2CVX1_9MICO|nr:NUDIX domain-containing protein [Promicromonospora iranensis]MDR7385426.1 8-oxo-dGTP pyrophosphatase MutT (NUDIX family) [Promicromonospora iranensis]
MASDGGLGQGGLTVRFDYFDDPTAPPVNSVVPSVTVAVRDDVGRLLLIHRTDNDLWALPGGGIDPGETVREAGVRETEEETGYRVRITGLVGIYTDPRHVIEYSDGEVRAQFSICMRGTVTGGAARTSVESSEVVWQQVDRLGELAIHPSMRLRIEHAVDPTRTQPFLT